MRSRRPRGVDLVHHDLTAEAQQMSFLCVLMSVCVYFRAQICVGVSKIKRGNNCEI